MGHVLCQYKELKGDCGRMPQVGYLRKSALDDNWPISTRWGAQRRVFGKPLLAQAVIRAK